MYRLRDKWASAMKEANVLGFEVFMVIVKGIIIWDVIPCELRGVYRHYSEMSVNSYRTAWRDVREDSILQGKRSQKAEAARTEQGTSVSDTPKKLKHLNYSDFCFSE